MYKKLSQVHQLRPSGILGLVFNFIDGELPKRFFSEIGLKGLSMKLAEKRRLDYETTGKLSVEVDWLKSLEN